jgi:hypothetical protein
MREFVKEGDIYKRERLVNLKILPYVLSKVWVAVILAFYQAAAFVLIRSLAFDSPGGTTEFLLVYATLVLAITAGMMAGLFASVLSPNPNSAPLFVILLILPQMILNGALIPLPQTISSLTINYWGFKALMGISGAGSDVAGDACWSLPEEVRDDLTLDDKDARNCLCMGTNVLDQESCDFPGIGEFYDPAVDQSAPVKPPPLGDAPPEPVLPQRPTQPDDPTDAVAMTEFFSQLQDWETEVQDIQAEYRSQVEDYQAAADAYKDENIAYQESLVEWNMARTTAIVSAENIIKEFDEIIGWSFMDKDDTALFRRQIAETWLALFVIIAIFTAGILLVQKLKDGR